MWLNCKFGVQRSTVQIPAEEIGHTVIYQYSNTFIFFKGLQHSCCNGWFKCVTLSQHQNVQRDTVATEEATLLTPGHEVTTNLKLCCQTIPTATICPEYLNKFSTTSLKIDMQGLIFTILGRIMKCNQAWQAQNLAQKYKFVKSLWHYSSWTQLYFLQKNQL